MVRSQMLSCWYLQPLQNMDGCSSPKLEAFVANNFTETHYLSNHKVVWTLFLLNTSLWLHYTHFVFTFVFMAWGHCGISLLLKLYTHISG